MHPAIRHRALALAALVLLASAARAQTLAGHELVAALQRGGYVIALRHAASPRTPPDAATANADNPARERQLDDTGRRTAAAMGQALRRLGIPVGVVWSSPTYRALETVRLAGLPAPRLQESLGDGGHSMQQASADQATWLRQQAATSPGATNVVIVTHFPNLSAAFPDYTRDLADGEALILAADGKGGARLVARVRITDWPTLGN